MNTTNLFVELVVIGVGALGWLSLLLLGVIGLPPLGIDNALLIASAIPLLALIYVLGIVWDRFADFVFDRLWGAALRREFYDDERRYYDDRRDILTRSAPLAELLEYGRSRLRICRGWSLNALGVAVAWPFFVGRRLDQHPDAPLLALTGAVACLALALACWFAWRNLTRVEYRKIRDQAAYLSPADGA